MKEMEYTTSFTYCEIEFLDEGNYNGYDYYITSCGAHPCAYVALTDKHPFFGKDYDDIPIDVHGGITFGCELHPHIGKICIGWDYAHLGDYNPYLPHIGGHKWTTKEIQQDIYNVIKQLKDYEQD